MSNGKISYNKMQRCIRKNMKSESALLPGFLQYRDCAETVLSNGTSLVQASGGMQLAFPGQEELLAARVCREASCMGVVPSLLNGSLSVSADADEKGISEISRGLAKFLKDGNPCLGQLSVWECRDQKLPFLSLTVSGIREGGQRYLPHAGDFLLAAGTCGGAGAGLIAENFYSELSERYAGSFLDGALRISEKAFQKDNDLSGLSSKAYLFPAQEGGVFAALWYLADGLSLGFDLELKKLPILQETVEICEFFHLNPYCLISDGMFLAVTDDPETVMRFFAERKLCCRIVGSMTDGKAKIIRNEDEIRYLDKPAEDEWYRMIRKEET